MKNHDPLCPVNTMAPGEGGCYCTLVARIRADERRRELLAVCECGCRERDAHAEAVALRERPGVFDVVRGSCGHRWLAENAGLDWCPICTDVGYKVKARLADLRAKVDGLAVRLTDDGVGTSLYVFVKRADVLALIEEVGRG